MEGIVLVVVVAIIVEALIEYAKSVGKLFVDGKAKTAVTQLFAVLVAVLLCFCTGADLFASLGVEFAFPWVGVVLTGIFGSRGANYVSDIISKIQGVKKEE